MILMQESSCVCLNPDLIKNCNDKSDYDAGDVITSEAENTYKGFANMVKSFGKLNDEQLFYMEERQAEWKKLVEQVYNAELIRRGNIIPLHAKQSKVKIVHGQELNNFIADTVMEVKRLNI